VELHPAVSIFGIVVEAVAVFLYVLVVLVLPEIIEVNKLIPKFLSVATVPLMLARNGGSWCTFNPSVVYALWYVNRAPVLSGGLLPALSLAHFALPSALQVLQFVAPFLGAAAAGVLCNCLFADNPTSWRRRSARFR
jgi:hypothetical protein